MSDKKQVRVSIEHVDKSYGKKQVLKDLNLEAYAGEVFGYIGKNGIGKSTTIDCRIGAKPFDKGTILLNGYDVKKEPLEAKASFGYVASEPNCYGVRTGWEYLDFIASIYEVDENDFQKNVNYLAKRLALTNDDLKKKTEGYSHGRKQKLCLIASLLHKPDIWILDEPTVGLDIMGVEALTARRKEYAKAGRLVFLTSHNIDLVSSLCDRVGIVNNGHVEHRLDFNADPDYRIQLKNIFFTTYQRKEERDA